MIAQIYVHTTYVHVHICFLVEIHMHGHTYMYAHTHTPIVSLYISYARLLHNTPKPRRPG